MNREYAAAGASKTDPEASSAIRLERLIQQRGSFLNFLASRVGDRETAEDILQAAYVKACERLSQLRDDESVTAWFYRILRNAITDHYRKSAVHNKRLSELAAEASLSYENELQQQICSCISDVVMDLKPQYRQAVEEVDLGGKSLAEFAGSQGISVNNASVRLHRARKAAARDLKRLCGVCAEHKCLDCRCRRLPHQL